MALHARRIKCPSHAYYSVLRGSSFPFIKTTPCCMGTCWGPACQPPGCHVRLGYLTQNKSTNDGTLRNATTRALDSSCTSRQVSPRSHDRREMRRVASAPGANQAVNVSDIRSELHTRCHGRVDAWQQSAPLFRQEMHHPSQSPGERIAKSNGPVTDTTRSGPAPPESRHGGDIC